MAVKLFYWRFPQIGGLRQNETSPVSYKPQLDGCRRFCLGLNSQGAFPHSGNPPAHFLEIHDVSVVPCDVLGEFLRPEYGV
jgi:hypothetical protein